MKLCLPCGWRALLTGVVTAICAASPASADIVRIIGASLRVTEGAPTVVEAKFLGDPAALYDNELFLDAPTFIGPIFNNHTTPPDTTVPLGTFLPETVLFIRNQAFFIPNPGSPASYNFGFFTGDGMLPLNPDRLPHAVFEFDTSDPDAGVTVSFEDQFGGGDLDFNDAVYSFTNVYVGFVDVALSPVVIGPGESVTVNDSESVHFAALDDLFGNAGDIINNGSVTNYGDGENSGSFDNSGGFFNDLPAKLTNAAGGQFSSSGWLTNFGSVVNEGELENSGDLANGGSIDSSGTIRNAASVVNSGAASVTNAVGGAIDNIGTWVNRSGTTTQNDGTITNSGSFYVEGGASVSGSGSYEAIGAAATYVSGSMQAALIKIQGFLGGSGTLQGPVDAESNATISPGDSPGTLTVDGDFALTGGALVIEISSPGEHDVLAITGAATFTGGLVEYRFLQPPAAGESYTWLTATEGITGADTLANSVTGGPAGLAFHTEGDGTSLVLRVVADADGDGIADEADNCIQVANVNQRDTDGDQYGNLCDGDLNNSGGMVNFADLALFRARFGGSDADADFDGNGQVNFVDLAHFRAFFGKPAGPSGTVPP